MIRYYWTVIKGFLWVIWYGLLHDAVGFRATFAELAIERGVARADLAETMFGPFGHMHPAGAVEEARLAREAAAAAGFQTENVAVFRHRLQALNTLRAAVDLGIIEPDYLAGLTSDGVA